MKISLDTLICYHLEEKDTYIILFRPTFLSRTCFVGDTMSGQNAMCGNGVTGTVYLLIVIRVELRIIVLMAVVTQEGSRSLL
ncbi:hypothetical protein [Methanospirillum lacunae]|uniref:hypothetical protein n=1 Tax=Methanospirillum lacunae TaxID=668570 RepID=UPI0038FD0036